MNQKTKGILFLVIFFLLLGLGKFVTTSNYIKKDFMSIGISTYIPSNITIGHSESKLFSYKNTTIPTLSIQGVDKDTMINFKTFPFTPEDYKKHFKSAFNEKDLDEIKYDYKEITVNNQFLSKVYKSKAILNKDGEKKYAYSYLISFKNKSGTLLIDVSSKKDRDFNKIIKKLKVININTNKIEFKPYNTKLTQELAIQDDIIINVPEDMKFKSNELNGVKTYRGISANEVYYISLSKATLPKTTLFSWKNINGYEILKEFDKQNFLIRDLNMQKAYYMNSTAQQIQDKKGIKYNLKIEKLYK